MNDRFKFRVWDKGNKRYQGTQDWQPYLDTDGDVCFINTDDVRNYPPENYFIIEQCTGLKDKNGKLIYEGDVVRFEIVDNDSVLGKTFERICEICFGKGDYSYSFVCKNDAYYHGYALLSSILCQEIESIEIIGNIHEQAEQKD